MSDFLENLNDNETLLDAVGETQTMKSGNKPETLKIDKECENEK